MPKVPKMPKLPKIKDVNHYIKIKVPKSSGYFKGNLAGFSIQHFLLLTPETISLLQHVVRKNPIGP